MVTPYTYRACMLQIYMYSRNWKERQTLVEINLQVIFKAKYKRT
jgi:hypothetical protein